MLFGNVNQSNTVKFTEHSIGQGSVFVVLIELKLPWIISEELDPRLLIALLFTSPFTAKILNALSIESVARDTIRLCSTCYN